MKVMRVTGRAAGLLILAASFACSRKPASVQVSPRRIVLYGMDRSQRLTVRVLDAKGEPMENPRPTYASQKPEVAQVDDVGRVLSKGEGKSIVTVQAGPLSATVPVEVIDAAALEIVPPQATLVGPAGTTFPLTAVVKSSKALPVAARPTWTSSDEKIARVGADGTVTTVSDGTASITAHLGELQAAAEISVMVRELARLELRPATALVRVGDSQKFQVVAFAPDGTRIENAIARFRTSNPAVATIDGAGVASGVAAGTTTIVVELAGRTAEATLIVN